MRMKRVPMVMCEGALCASQGITRAGGVIIAEAGSPLLKKDRGEHTMPTEFLRGAQ
jgi:hypothetical protein